MIKNHETNRTTHNILYPQDNFYIGDWLVLPMQNQLKKTDNELTIEPKLMQVLHYLCTHAPRVVSADEIIDHCWPNQFLSDNPIHKSIAQLRKALGDSPKKPKYIKTIPKKGYAIIADLRGLADTSGKQNTQKFWTNGSPYPGLKYYDEDYKDVFFGRSKATSEIKQLINQLNPEDDLALFLLGASGVGKTSLMKTIVLPYLKNPDYAFKINFKEVLHYSISIQNDKPFLQSFLGFLQHNNVLKDTVDHNQQIENIRNQTETVSGLINAPTVSASPAEKWVLFIDQVERIFVENNELNGELNLFFNILLQLLESKKIFIIVSLKHEYYADIMQYESFEKLKKRALQYDLPYPDLSEIIQIVHQPVKAAGMEFEFDTHKYEKLDDVIIDEAQQISHVLPILNHTLRELTLNTNKNQQLTFKEFHRMGGLMGALAYKVDSIYEPFSASEKAAFEKKLHHLIQFVPGTTNKLFCAKADIRLFHKDGSQHIIKSFIEAHLLQSEVIADNSYVSIIHESLLEQSELFKSWINENKFSLSVLHEIRTLAHQWNIHNNNKDYLLSNDFLLDQSCSLLSSESGDFNACEQSFIRQSLRKKKRQKQLSWLSLSSLAVLLVSLTFVLFQYRTLNANLQLNNEQAEGLVGYMLDELNNKLRPIGKLDLLDEIGRQVMGYYAQSDQILSEKSILNRIEALNTLGEVKIKKGLLQEAEQYFKEASEQFISFTNDTSSNTALMFKISQTQYWLGYKYYLDADYAQTEHHWLGYLELAQRMVKLEPDHSQWQLELSYALNNLGTLSFSLKKYDKAEEYINASAQLKTSLLSHNPLNTQYLAELADTTSWQASVLDKKNQLNASKDIFKKSLALTQKLNSIEPTNRMWKQRLGQAHFRLAMKHYDMGELQLAETQINQALPIFIELHDTDQSHQIWLRELADQYLMLAKINQHRAQLDDALFNINLGLSYSEKYTDESRQTKAVKLQRLHFTTVSSLIFAQMDKPKAALSQFEDVINEIKIFDTKASESESFYLAFSLYTLSQLQKKNAYDQLADLTMVKAKTIIDKRAHENLQDNKTMALNLAISHQISPQEINADIAQILEKRGYKNPDYLPK
ncbi:winged helix-turn-helix domain-containing protein [Marinicella sp. W31]|uniref:nSTAND1 domain-containing NTPase n=1 Tax=Marinicella sp. W31 TaxID=3023713 RepID=UPI0037581461